MEKEFRLKPRTGKHRISGGQYVVKVSDHAYTLLIYMKEHSDESIMSIVSKAIEYAYKDLVIDVEEDFEDE